MFPRFPQTSVNRICKVSFRRNGRNTWQWRKYINQIFIGEWRYEKTLTFPVIFARHVGHLFPSLSQKKINVAHFSQNVAWPNGKSTAFWTRKGIFDHDWFFFFTNRVRIRIRILIFMFLGTVLFLSSWALFFFFLLDFLLDASDTLRFWWFSMAPTCLKDTNPNLFHFSMTPTPTYSFFRWHQPA